MRILDDTVRLRDIVASLPPINERRFVPTLVVVHWLSKNDGDVPDDFAEEVSIYPHDFATRLISG